MAEIKQYVSPEALQGLRPAEGGAEAYLRAGRMENYMGREAGEAIGRGIGALGRAGEVAVEHEGMQEISQGAADSAQQDVDAMKRLNAIFADPQTAKDPTQVQKFLTDLKQQKDEWVDKFNTERGKMFAVEQSNRSLEHFYHVASADQANYASAMAEENVAATMKGYSNLAVDNPGGLDTYVSAFKASLDHAFNSPNIDAATGIKAKTELYNKGASQIAEAAFLSASDKNPVAAIKDLDAGKYDAYVTGDEKEKWKAHAVAMQELQRRLSLEGRADADRSALIRTNQRIGEIYQSTLTPNGVVKGPQQMEEFKKLFSSPDVMDHPEAFKDAEAFGKWLFQKPKEPTGDPATFNAMGKAALAGNLTNADIFRAETAGDLSRQQATVFHEFLNSNEKLSEPDKVMMKASTDGALMQITGNTTWPALTLNQSQEQKIARFQTWFQPAFLAERAKGHTVADLMNPSSPNYMFKPENLKQFETTGDDLHKTSFLGSILHFLTGSSSDQTQPAKTATPAPNPEREQQLRAILFGSENK